MVNAELKPSHFVVEPVGSGLAKTGKGVCADVAWQLPASLPNPSLTSRLASIPINCAQKQFLPDPQVREHLAVKN
jgi:hypothetical protein